MLVEIRPRLKTVRHLQGLQHPAGDTPEPVRPVTCGLQDRSGAVDDLLATRFDPFMSQPEAGRSDLPHDVSAQGKVNERGEPQSVSRLGRERT